MSILDGTLSPEGVLVALGGFFAGVALIGFIIVKLLANVAED